MPPTRPPAVDTKRLAAWACGPDAFERHLRDAEMELPARLEKDIQRDCLDWLRAQGFAPVRVNSGGRPWTDRKGKARVMRMNDSPGCADVLACVGGRFVSVEVKRPGGHTPPKRLAEQASFARMVERAGGVALTVESVKELEADLRAAGLME